ncbi:hypothetical protein ACA910_021570 [Epithemia clementina (nom. ined.)]
MDSSVGSTGITELLGGGSRNLIDLTDDQYFCMVIMKWKYPLTGIQVGVVCGKPKDACRRRNHIVHRYNADRHGRRRIYQPLPDGKSFYADGRFYPPSFTSDEVKSMRMREQLEIERDTVGLIQDANAAELEPDLSKDKEDQ